MTKHSTSWDARFDINGSCDQIWICLHNFSVHQKHQKTYSSQVIWTTFFFFCHFCSLTDLVNIYFHCTEKRSFHMLLNILYLTLHNCLVNVYNNPSNTISINAENENKHSCFQGFLLTINVMNWSWIDWLTRGRDVSRELVGLSEVPNQISTPSAYLWLGLLDWDRDWSGF